MNSCKSTNLSSIAGVGLRSPHINHVIKNHKIISKKIGWFEVHSENYHNISGQPFKNLELVRKNFPISLHSVGNSLGSAQGLDNSHLKKLKNLIEAIQPFLVSDHISWGRVDKNHLNDLLPLPYTKESLQIICANIAKMQDFLGREILIENPSAYVSFIAQDFDEAEFINEITKKTGCGLLLDVNNVFVSSQNCSAFQPKEYLQKLNKKIVKEIHLAGHSQSKIFDGKNYQPILIDTHNDLVCDEVWEIYKMAVEKFKSVPFLIEWDQDFPEFKVLVDEAKKAAKFHK